MGKETELWDDSALIKAFDSAISKYKEMHNIPQNTNPDEEKQQQQENQQQQQEFHENEVTPIQGKIELDDNAADVSSNTYQSLSDAIATTELQPINPNQFVTEHSASVPSVEHQASGPAVHETLGGYGELQYTEYNQILSKYYEVEEQRQKLLHQLQASSSNYQTFDQGAGTCCPSNAYYPGQISYCSLCSCNCFVAPCSTTACAMGGQCPTNNGISATSTTCKVGPVKPSLSGDHCIIRAAHESIGRLDPANQLNTSMAFSISKDKVKERKETSEISDGGVSQNSGCQTDLNDVLNAWFTAGFYTGKYLSEQSLSKNQQ